MSRSSRGAVLGPAVLTLAMAEFGARLLSPREPLPTPAPVDLRNYFSEAEIARGARYSRPQMALGLARAAVQFGTLAGLTARTRRQRLAARPVRALRRRLVESFAATRPGRSRDRTEVVAGRGAVAGASLVILITVPGLPLAALARRRAIAVGLVTQSWRGWVADLVKSSAIEVLFAAGAGAAVTEVARRFPRRWWLFAGAGSVAVGTLLGALAPVLLDPLFNDFTPLSSGPLRDDVLSLAERAGVRVGEVYSIDASRRTTAANAYVTGLGPTKRVVLFDTLLDRYSEEEVRSVVAHELAHVRHRDVQRSVLYGALVAVPAALAVDRLSRTLAPLPVTAETLPVLALAAGVVALPTGLIGNRLSRAVERRADAFAISLSRAPEAFISFERAIALQNVADLDPPWWVTRILATHPSTAERIGVAVAATPPPPGPGPDSDPGTRGDS